MSQAKELRARSSEELKTEIVELKREQFNLRMQRGTGQLGSPARFKELRRELARIKTVLNEQKRQASETSR